MTQAVSPVAPTVATMLTVRDHMMLDLEASWWKYAGAKEAHVRKWFGVSSTR